MEENKKRKYIVGFSIGAAVVSLFGIAVCADKMNTMQKMIAGSTERINQMTHVDLDKRMVDQMVQKAVREQSGSVVRDAASKVEHDMMADIRNRVKQAVQNQTNEISKKVSKKVAEEIADISRDEIMDTVIQEVTDKLVEKLSDDLDEEVGRVGKIYQGIAAALR